MASGALLPNTTEREPAQNKRKKVYNLLPKLILPCYLFKEGEQLPKNVKTAEQDRFFSLYLHHCL